MPTLPSNNFKYLLMQSDIDFGADTFSIILMRQGFAFNRATHDDYADVSPDELATGGGYTAGGQPLAGGALTRNDPANLTTMTWNNASWLATGGDIVTQGAIIVDTTVSGSPIIGYIDFGETLTTFETGTFTVTGIAVEL